MRTAPFRTHLAAVVSVFAVVSAFGSTAPGQASGAEAKGGIVIASCQVRASGITGFFPFLLHAQLPDGTVLLGSTYVKGGSSVTVLRAVLPNCRPAERFGTQGTATITVAVPAGSSGIGAITAAPDGQVVLAGGAGKQVVVGKLRANGSLDTNFGSGGWSRLDLTEQPPNGMPLAPVISSIALNGKGEIYLGGDDGSAHCCVEDFVTALSPKGHLDRAFGADGWADLEDLGGSYTTDLILTGKGLLVMGFVMYTGCGGPVLARLNWGGHLDKAFDEAAQRAIEPARPHYVLVGPALYLRPGGAFAVAAALMPSGCQVHMAKPLNTGLTLGFHANGTIDTSFGTSGQAAFPAESAAQVWAVAQPNGSALVISDKVSGGGTYSPPRYLQVRQISPTGRFNPAFGHAGSEAIDLAWAWGTNMYPAVDAFGASNGSAVLAVAAKQRIVIYRLGG